MKYRLGKQNSCLLGDFDTHRNALMHTKKGEKSGPTYNGWVVLTIADLEGQEEINPEHIADTISCRKLDRNL